MADDHTVIVTIEYHAMAESPVEAVERVLSNLSTNSGRGDLLPMCLSIAVDESYSRKATS